MHVKDELCTYTELLLPGMRIVISNILRNKVLQIAQEGRQGIVKTKTRSCSKVWWPKIDSDVETLCKACHCCQVEGQLGAPEPMPRFVPSTAPWQDISADLLGPLPTGKSILVVVDYFNRFFKLAVSKSTTSAKIIGAIHPIFAQFGVPCSLWTDNGLQFVSEEFETFLQTQGHWALSIGRLHLYGLKSTGG